MSLLGAFAPLFSIQPVADTLRDEIEKQVGNGSEYVFPEAAHLYKTNANGIFAG